MKTFLITGAAGFIGFHLTLALCRLNHRVIGYDNINDYYDINLKYARLNELGINREAAEIFKNKVESNKYNFTFYRAELEDDLFLDELFNHFHFDGVINLAGQAGVRHSIDNPKAYGKSNVIGFLNILECCRKYGTKQLLYASSSSIYGNSNDVPFSISQNVDNPISLYAATKKANELMAHSYSHLFNLKTIGLRFFTVYGPWGRPDMAMFLFTDAILNNQPLKVFNNGDLSRDFTYIDDIIQGMLKLIEVEHQEFYQLYNIGNSKPVKLLDFIKFIEKITNIKANLLMLPMQPGDVNQTWADVDDLKIKFGYNPQFTVETGVKNFIDWYKFYYKVEEVPS